MQDGGAAGTRFDLRGLKKQGGAKTVALDALALKEAGNAAFKAGDLAEAELQYTAALGKSPASGLKVVVLSNRAEVFIQQHRPARATYVYVACLCVRCVQSSPAPILAAVVNRNHH